MIEVAHRNGHGLPLGVAFEYFGVDFAVLFRRNGGTNSCFYFLRRRPNIAQKNGLAGIVIPQGFCGQVQVHATGKGIGDHQWGRRKIIGADKWMDAAFKIAVTAEDGNRDHIVFLNGRTYCVGQRDHCCRYRLCTRSRPD